VEGNPRFRFTVDQRPVDRAAAPVPWQQRAVQVEAPVWGNFKYGCFDQVPVVERKYDFRIKAPDLFHPDGVVDVVRHERGNLILGSQFRHGIKPDVFIGVVAVSKNSPDIESVFQQSIDADAPDRVISQYNGSHNTLL